MKTLMRKPNYLIIIILLLAFCWQAHQVVEAQGASYVELIGGPVLMTAVDSIIIQNGDLPVVTNEVSVSLRLNLLGHDAGWAAVFHKGMANFARKIRTFVFKVT